MADHDTGDSRTGNGPGWLFRLNTTLGARLNTPAWMGAAENEAPSHGATPESPAEPEPALPPLVARKR